MDHEIVYDMAWATVRYYPGDQYIYHTFHGPMSGQSFYDTLNAGLEALAKHKAIKWLSDDRKNAEFAPEDIGFVLEDWAPRAAKAGWKFWALVVPEDIAGRAGMMDIVEAFHNMGVQVAIFTEVEPARQWLLAR
jgi:hypothetical protein